MKSDGYFQGGAAESCRTIQRYQRFVKRCGRNRPIDAESEFPAAPAPAPRAFKSLASTNSAMPAPLGFTGFSAIRATDVLQIDRRVLQIAGIASVRNVAT